MSVTRIQQNQGDCETFTEKGEGLTETVTEIVTEKNVAVQVTGVKGTSIKGKAVQSSPDRTATKTELVMEKTVAVPLLPSTTTSVHSEYLENKTETATASFNNKKTEAIQSITPQTTDTVTTPNGKEDNTYSVCSARPGNSPDAKPDAVAVSLSSYNDSVNRRYSVPSGPVKLEEVPLAVFEPVAGCEKPLKVPASIGLTTSARRQDFIVKELNRKHGKHFQKESPMGSVIEGYKVCAYDPKEQLILITCDDMEFARSSYIQKVCNHFYQSDYTVCLWIGEFEKVVLLGKVEES